jgi:TonB family protein
MHVFQGNAQQDMPALFVAITSVTLSGTRLTSIVPLGTFCSWGVSMQVQQFSETFRGSRSLGAWTKFALSAVALLFCLSTALPQLSAQASVKSGRKIVTEIQPEYPSYLKNIHIEGQVRLDVIVLPNGNVSKVEIRGGNPILAENAAKAVMKWKFVPAAAETVEEVRVSFNSH